MQNLLKDYCTQAASDFYHQALVKLNYMAFPQEDLDLIIENKFVTVAQRELNKAFALESAAECIERYLDFWPEPDAVLVSGGGTNLQALIDAQARGELGGGELAAVISSKADAYALERAKNAGIPGYVVARKDYDSNRAMTQALVSRLKELNIDLVVLAGFMHILTEEMVQAYPNAILNVHPALIPSFCGAGYYGLHVHEKALAYGVKVTGATVHFVNEEPDGGPIILQKAVDILPGDTPEVLQRRVMEQAEWHILPQAVALFCQGRLSVEGRIVTIKKGE